MNLCGKLGSSLRSLDVEDLAGLDGLAAGRAMEEKFVLADSVEEAVGVLQD